MKINIECQICNLKIEKPVRCTDCNNLFCKKCIVDWMNLNKTNDTNGSCPVCRKNYNFVNYSEFDNLINSSSSIFRCENCNIIFFDKEKFDKHKISCFHIKCMICHEIFKDNQSFLKHFEEEGRFQEKFLICNYLNANPFTCIQNNINYNENENYENKTPFGPESLDSNKFNKYEPYSGLIKNENDMNPYKNNFKVKSAYVNVDELKSNNINGSVLNKEYDIYYCNKRNAINNKLCSPGNELCSSCMKINQKYHKLKKHYLINSAGRVCTYGRNNVYCLCHFERYIEDNKFCPDLICFQKDICKPCYEMKKLINLYLTKNLMNKLKKRDENFGY